MEKRRRFLEHQEHHAAVFEKPDPSIINENDSIARAI